MFNHASKRLLLLIGSPRRSLLVDPGCAGPAGLSILVMKMIAREDAAMHGQQSSIEALEHRASRPFAAASDISKAVR